MSTDITIRSIVESDLPAVVAIQSHLTPSSLETAQRAFDRIKRYPSYDVYLAFRAEEPVGTFAMLIMDNLGHLGAPLAVVENVVVDPSSRRQGIGRAMMMHAFAVARANACYKLILASNVKLIEPHKFYEQLGFTKQGYAFAIDLESEPSARTFGGTGA
jgi:GNAT superfamily N-acetyltransferase